VENLGGFEIMMWIVYQIDNAEITDKFYSKKAAKYSYWYDLSKPDESGLALEKVDMLKLDEWKMWKILGGGRMME
jgi:hypothetical protein